MSVKVLLVMATFIVSNQGYALNINTRQASVPPEHDQRMAESVWCMGLAMDMCPQFASPFNNMSGNIVGNHLAFSCSESTLYENRNCASRARVGCEAYRYWSDGFINLWEDMCYHEKDLVENAACLAFDQIPKGVKSCLSPYSTVMQECQETPNCVRNVIMGLQPQCDTEFAHLMYNLVKNTTDILFGTQCERLSFF